MSKFAEIVICPRMRLLNFGLVPSCLRYRIIDALGSFTYLKVLILGSSSGGQWSMRHVTDNLIKVDSDTQSFTGELSLGFSA